jgi:hypothetical protein
VLEVLTARLELNPAEFDKVVIVAPVKAVALIVPETSNFVDGDVVPIPIFPPVSIATSMLFSLNRIIRFVPVAQWQKCIACVLMK